MTAPVVGPIVKPTVTVTRKHWNGPGLLKTRVKERTGYRQRRPYNLPLPATMSDISARDSVTDTRIPASFCYLDSGAYSDSWKTSEGPGRQMYLSVYNQAYARLTDQLLGDAALGINIVQRKEAMSMVADRALQLYSFSRHLRRLEFAKAADDLNISRKRLKNLNLKSEAKGFGNNFLEFHFGWSPAIHDIYKAIDLSQHPIPDSFIKASAKDQFRSASVDRPVNMIVRNERAWSVKVNIGTHLRVSNPNLWLANKMGLVNPAIVIYDSIPFSFVEGWFSNLSAVMASWTDFAGLTLVNPWNSTYSKSFFQVDSYYPLSNFWTYRGATWTVFQRSLGVGNGPTLKVKKSWKVSSTRGATAVSLLLQSLRGK